MCRCCAPLLAALLIPTAASAATTLKLPYVEDFESGSGFLVDWNKSNNGSSNEAKYVSSPVYEGKKSFMFVVDTKNDPKAYRSEVQSHPPSDDFIYGDTFWIGLAVYWPLDYKTAEKGHVTFMQLKHLSPQKQIYFSEYNGKFYLGNGHSKPEQNIYSKPATKGTWYYVVTRINANCQADGGQVRMWIENGDQKNPDIVNNADILDDAGGCKNMKGNELYLKLGMYRSWMRHYPSDIVTGEHKIVYDNIRICREGTSPCGTEKQAFDWIIQGKKGSGSKPAPGDGPPQDAGTVTADSSPHDSAPGDDPARSDARESVPGTDSASSSSRDGAGLETGCSHAHGAEQAGGWILALTALLLAMARRTWPPLLASIR